MTRKLTGQQRAMLRKLAADNDQWVLWQSLGYPYSVLDALRIAGYVRGETWVTGYVVQITAAGKEAIE